MRLLIVEDEPRISEIIKAALERAEFAVDTVRLRADAQEALANTAYDAAILDLGLPRFGSFVAVYGLKNTIEMIDGALARSA